MKLQVILGIILVMFTVDGMADTARPEDGRLSAVDREDLQILELDRFPTSEEMVQLLLTEDQEPELTAEGGCRLKPSRRWTALGFLRYHRDKYPGARETVFSIFQNTKMERGSYLLKFAAADTLSYYGDLRWIPEMSREINNSDSLFDVHDKIGIAGAMARCGDCSAFEYVTAHLKDADERVRERAIRVLKCFAAYGDSVIEDKALTLFLEAGKTDPKDGFRGIVLEMLMIARTICNEKAKKTSDPEVLNRLADKRDKIIATMIEVAQHNVNRSDSDLQRQCKIIVEHPGHFRRPNIRPDEKNEKQEAWGEAAEGLQCRLGVDKRVWPFDDGIELTLDFRNVGNTDISCPNFAQLCEVESDGQWYTWTGPTIAEMFTVMLKPNQEALDSLKITLPASWVSSDSGVPLSLMPGKHTIRVKVQPLQRGVRKSDPVPSPVISNPVAIEICPVGDMENSKSNYPLLREDCLALLAVPEPQLRHANQAIKLFEGQQDWASLATAYETAAEIMWHVTHSEPNAFIRQPDDQPEDSMPNFGGPYVMVQSDLDGEWVKGKGGEQNWLDWIQRKQKDLAAERISILKKLGVLCVEHLNDPVRAVSAYEAAGRDVPLLTESLEMLIPQIYPELKSDPNFILGIDQNTRPEFLRFQIPQMAQIHLESLRGLAQAQAMVGNLSRAGDACLRAMLTALILDHGDWNACGSEKEAEAFWLVVQQLPADQPLPPTLWLNVLAPQDSEKTIAEPEDGPHKYPYSHPGPRFVIRPGGTAKTLTVSADMETSGGCGMVRCFTMLSGKVYEIGQVYWHMDSRKGRQWRQETFDLPEDVGIIRLEIMPFNGTDFHVRNLKVKAGFVDSVN